MGIIQLFLITAPPPPLKPSIAKPEKVIQVIAKNCQKHKKIIHFKFIIPKMFPRTFPKLSSPASNEANNALPLETNPGISRPPG